MTHCASAKHTLVLKKALYNSSFWFNWIVCTIHIGSYLNSSINILRHTMWDQVYISQAIYRWAKILHMFASDRIVNHCQHFPNSTNTTNVHNTIWWAFFSVCSWFTDCSKGSIQIMCMFWRSQSTPLLIQCRCTHWILNNTNLYLAAN